MRQRQPDPMNRIIALFVLVFIGLMLILIIMKPNRAAAECNLVNREEAYAYMDSVLSSVKTRSIPVNGKKNTDTMSAGTAILSFDTCKPLAACPPTIIPMLIHWKFRLSGQI